MRRSAHLDLVAIPCGVIIMTVLVIFHVNGMCEAATFTPAAIVAVLRHLGREI
jgi:hypothetical protein